MHKSFSNKRKSSPLEVQPFKKFKFQKSGDDESDNESGEIEKALMPLSFLMPQNQTVLRKANHIYFRAPVNTANIHKLGTLLDEANSEFETLKAACTQAYLTPKPIYLHITSNGGGVTVGFLGADMIRNSRIPVYTIVEGHAASAATFLSIVGKKRYITENSYLLIHQLSSFFGGKFAELKDDYKNSKQLMADLKNLYMKHCDVTSKELDKLLKHDLYWNYKTAQKYKLVDDIYREKDFYKID